MMTDTGGGSTRVHTPIILDIASAGHTRRHMTSAPWTTFAIRSCRSEVGCRAIRGGAGACSFPASVTRAVPDSQQGPLDHSFQERAFVLIVPAPVAVVIARHHGVDDPPPIGVRGELHLIDAHAGPAAV